MAQLDATSQPTENQLIDEQVHHCQLTLVEGQGDKKGRVYARGEFGHAANPTANGRRYRHSIWENNISRLHTNLKSRKVLGELDHPTDGRTALQRASHVITALKLDGDQVIGEAEILNTAKGRDLKAILEAGVPVGISSRGFGTTKPGKDGIEEVQDDYKLVTFDFVAEPADPSAYPEVVFESADEGEQPSMMFEGAAFEMLQDDDEADEEVEEEDNRAPVVAAPDESELAKKFAQHVLADAGDLPEDKIEALRQEFSSEIISRVAALRQDVEKQVRAEMEADPAIAGARTALEQVQRTLLPFALTEDANDLLNEYKREIHELRKQLEDAEERIESGEALIERLTEAAREAGYKYHLECLLHEDDADIERLRAIVGDVSQYDSPDALRERVEEAHTEMQAFRLEEERILQKQSAEADRLREQNQQLAEGLEEALVANRDLALQVYAAQRLQTHPQGAKIRKMLKRTGVQSREQVDALIEDFREPKRDVDDLETVRSRVRSLLVGGREYLPEETDPPQRRSGGQDYNGLGVSLNDLRHLAGVK